MRQKLFKHRPGTSLIELMLFTALLGFVGLVVLDMLILSSDNQSRQKAIADVEQSGVQLSQLLASELRHAERIILPAMGQTGSIAMVQKKKPDGDPTIVGVQSGSMLLIERATEFALNDPKIAVSDFMVTNTSSSADHPSMQLSFTITQELNLPSIKEYVQSFDAAIVLFPDDVLEGGECGTGTCAKLACDPIDSYYEWEICSSDTCEAVSGSLLCTP